MSFKKNENLNIGSGLLTFHDNTMLGSPWCSTEVSSSVGGYIIPFSSNSSINVGVKRGGVIRVPDSCWLHGVEAKTIFPFDQGDSGSLTLERVPVVPVDFSVYIINFSSVELNWNNYSVSASGYIVERALNPNGPFTLIATLSADTVYNALWPYNVYYMDTELSSSITYYYRVASFSSIGNSEYTNVVSTSTSSFTITPKERIFIPSGSFLMGYSGVGDELAYFGALQPRYSSYIQETVEVPDFWIDKYKVTRGEYKEFIAAGGYTEACSSYWSTDGWAWKTTNNISTARYLYPCTQFKDNLELLAVYSLDDDCPFNSATFWEAEAYCNWKGGRIPTEEEWEKAARWDGHPRIYPWGDTWIPENCGLISAVYYPVEVGNHTQDISPYGCMDMAGNLVEWCQDWYKSYPDSDITFDYTDTYRCLRGGGYSTYCNPMYSRYAAPPSRNIWNFNDNPFAPMPLSRDISADKYYYYGFRLVTDTELVPGDYLTPEMIKIPAGTFLMGSASGYADSTPEHEVYLPDYWISKYEITRGEYKDFITWHGYDLSTYWSTGGWAWKASKSEPSAQLSWGIPYSGTGQWDDDIFRFGNITGGFKGYQSILQIDSNPAMEIAYHEAEAYCNWLGGHLPTEAQWEKAARWNPVASSGNIYPWGNTTNGSEGNFVPFAKNEFVPYHPVGKSLLDISPYGCIGMVTNGAEWCIPRYATYRYSNCMARGNSGIDGVGTPRPEYSMVIKTAAADFDSTYADYCIRCAYDA